MAKKTVTTRLDPVLVEQLDKIAQANKITRTQVIEELLLQSLEHQDEELASTFLLPRIESVLVKLFDQHLWSLRNVMIHSAVEASVSSRLNLLKFAADNGYSGDQLNELRNQAYKQAVRRLRKRGVQEDELADAD